MARRLITFALFILSIASTHTASANGILVTGWGGATPRGTEHAVRLQAHNVRVKMTDLVADVTVEQTFFNHSGHQLEGKYLFPLPEGAIVSQFSMTMAGKMVKGEVVEAKRAKQIYEGIVRRRADPGLLEYVGRGLFRASVFPIEAHKPLTIRLAFQLVLKDDAGTLEFRYPLATDRMNGAPVASVSLAMEVASSVDLKAIYSPSHRLDVSRSGERSATVSYTSTAQRQTRDLLLYIERNPDPVGISIVSQQSAGEDGTFMAVLAPPQTLIKTKRVPKDIVFVLDTSGSMAGEKMTQARNALIYGVRSLHTDDRFQMLTFASSVRPFRDGLSPASEAMKKAAEEWIPSLEAAGGTNLEEALRTALQTSRSERRLHVVLLTDGKPSVGEKDPTRLLAAVSKHMGAARIHTFGVGYNLDVNLLDRIAEASHGTRDYVAPGENIEVVTGRFFRRVRAPVLADVKLDFGKDVYDVYPKHIGDLYAGAQVVVFGRYRDAGPRRVRLTGLSEAGPIALEREANLTKQGPEYLQRLWASRKVAYLIDEMRLHGSSKEVVDEVVALATRHEFVTPYTSGLVVEDSNGAVQGHSDAPFKGPGSNGTIGIGGGAGGAFRGRGGGRDLGTGGGGRKIFDDAVDWALRWLAARQQPDGGWNAESFDAWCDGKPQAPTADASERGKAENSIGLTGLATSAFLSRGYTNRGKHDFARAVGVALRFLKNNQDPEGCFGKRGTPYEMLQHAWATLAMVDAYAMTGSPIFRGSAQRGLDFAMQSRNAEGVWSAQSGSAEVDSEATAWMSFVLHSCEVLNQDQRARGRPQRALIVSDDARNAVLAWARAQGSEKEPAHAQRLVAQALLRTRHTDAVAAANLAGVRALPPTWDPAAGMMDAARWHHGTYALFQLGGKDWDQWKQALEKALLSVQRKDGSFCDAKGSWDPHGPWANEGGRVYMTVMMARCLEAFYTYGRRLSSRSAPGRSRLGGKSSAERAHLSQQLKDMKEGASATDTSSTSQTVAGVRFEREAGGRWVDTRWDRTKQPIQLEAMSADWFALADKSAEIPKFLALGERVLLVLEGSVYEVVPATK